MRFRSAIYTALLFVLVGCGGRLGCTSHGDLVEQVNDSNVFINWSVIFGRALHGSSNGHVVFIDNSGVQYDSEVPPWLVITPGTPLVLFPKDTVVYLEGDFDDSFTQGSLLIDDLSGHSATLNTKLIRVGNGLALSDSFVLPPHQYSLTTTGPFLFAGKTKAKGLSVHDLRYVFEVFNEGTTSFSNIPQTIRGNFPINGQTTSAPWTVTGTIPPNQGQGSAFLDLTPFGGNVQTFTTTKPLGATSWQWTVPRPYTVPTQGFQSIGMRLNF